MKTVAVMPAGGLAAAGVLRSVYLANRATEATLRTILTLDPLVGVAPGPDGTEAGACSPEEELAVGGLLRMLGEELRLVGAVRRHLEDQADALARGHAEGLTSSSAATEQRMLALRDTLHARIRLARLLAGDASLPMPSAQLGAAAARIAAAERDLRLGAETAVASLRAGQSVLAAVLERWEGAELALGSEPAGPAVRSVSPADCGPTPAGGDRPGYRPRPLPAGDRPRMPGRGVE